jgi:hypothetical protein
MCGRYDDARALFEHLLALRNDVGLLAEEYDPAEKRQLGNFPQAFSHLALINTARNLAMALGPAQLRSAPHKHRHPSAKHRAKGAIHRRRSPHVPDGTG